MTKLVVAFMVLCAGAAVARADGVVSGRLTDVNDQPVKDARVRVVGSGAAGNVAVEVSTDATGHYQVTVGAGGVYTVTFAFGKTRLSAHVDVPEGGAATLDSTLAVAGEIIEIHGKPLREAKPKSDPLAIPPYSDQAALEDRWAKAWLLLDVDAHGVVSRIKFLKRPGYGLDAIAVKHGFGLRFDPERDASGSPSGTYIVWPLEWPSLGWLQSRSLLANRLPELEPAHAEGSVWFDGQPPGRVPPGRLRPGRLPPGGTSASGRMWQASYPPCAGGRTVNLGSVHPTLRDCSVPDLVKGGAGEPWIVRGADVPAPVVADAPVLDPVELRSSQLAAARSSRRAAIATTVTTGALAVATLAAYLQFARYADRVDADGATHTLLAPGQLAADRRGQRNWELGTMGLAAGAVLSGALSMHFWSASRELAIEPSAQGAQLSYAGRF